MKLTPLLYLLVHEPWIRNLDKPPCIHCEHYIPDPKESFSSTSGKCKMFGGKDLHTGKVIYDYANSVRQDESKCSVVGKYFVGEKQILRKKIVFLLQQPIVLSWLFFLLYEYVKKDKD